MLDSSKIVKGVKYNGVNLSLYEAPSTVTPAKGFVPTAWDANGNITEGVWYGGSIATYAFYNVIVGGTTKYLESLIIDNPSAVTSIGARAFYNCTNLALTSLPSEMTSIGIYAFYGCTNLVLTSLPSKLTSIDNYAFYNCTNLALTSLPSEMTSIGIYAFYGCTNLALTSLPSGVTNIDNYAFYNCTNLITLMIPCNPFVIGSSASSGSFANCTGLTSVTIGASRKPMTTTKLPGYSFYGCTSLTSITVYTEGATSLSTAPFGAYNATITYLDSNE